MTDKTNELAGMDKRIARRWIKALRSGKYKQGNGRLCRYPPNFDPRYCCLGVLVDLFKDEGVKVPNNWPVLMRLPPSIWRAANLPNGDPRVEVGGEVRAMSSLNDGTGFGGRKPKTFKQVADIIERRVFGRKG